MTEIPEGNTLFNSEIEVKRGEEHLQRGLRDAMNSPNFRPDVVRKIRTALLRAREALLAFPPEIRAVERGNVVFMAPRRRTRRCALPKT